MGITKTTLFTDAQNDLAQMVKVLGHPARIAIIQKLIALNACVCGDIVSDLGLAQATVSQHLKALKQAGLIQGTVEGTSVCYCLNIERWTAFEQQLSELFSQIKNANTQCC